MIRRPTAHRRPTRTRRALLTNSSVEPLENRLLFATFLVNTVLDTVAVNPAAHTGLDASGHISLRSAIMAADATPGSNTITLPALPAGSAYHLTLAGTDPGNASAGDLDVTSSLALKGAGSDLTIIDATGLGDRVFDVISATVSITGLTITGGQAARGAGVLNEGGTLTLTDTVVSGNKALGATGADGDWNQPATDGGAAIGGGIDNAAGSLSLVHSTVSNNQAVGGQGGKGSFGSANTGAPGGAGGAAFGGGVAGESGSVTLVHSTVSNNTAVGGQGGVGGTGVNYFAEFTSSFNSFTGTTQNDSATATITTPNGTGGLGGAGGAALGGGVYLASASMINQSELSSNHATGGAGGTGGTGASAHATFQITLNDSTFTSFNVTDTLTVTATGTGGKGGTGGSALGGAVYFAGNPQKINQSNLSDNSATGGAGGAGGLGARAYTSLTITQTGGNSGAFTLVDTQSDTATGTGGAGGTGGNGFGGAVYLASGPLMINQTSVTTNHATGGAAGAGGQAASPDATTTINGVFGNSIFITVTLTTSSSGSPGSPGTPGQGIAGGLYFAGGTLVLNKTLLSSNLASTSNNDFFQL